MKRKWKQALALALMLTVLCTSVQLETFAENAETAQVSEAETGTETADTATVTVTVPETEQTQDDSEQETEQETPEQETTEQTAAWDGTTTEASFEGSGYKVIFSLREHWDGGYNANVKIENTTDVPIEDWRLRMSYDGSIANIWNAVTESQENGCYVIRNGVWNQDIPANGSVEFGFSGSQSFAAFPTACELTGESSEVEKTDYSITYQLDSDWGSGFTARVNITNNTQTTLEDWVLEFDFDRTITNIWNGSVESHEGSHYVIKNMGYNSNLAPGGTVSFGFNGTDGSKENEPSNYRLYSYNAKKSGTATVHFDINTDDTGVTNIPDDQVVKIGEYAQEPDDPKWKGHIFCGWYTEKELEDDFDFETTTVDADATLYADWFDYEDETDSDQDGLPDTQEAIFETDPHNPDTDGDGLLDSVELDYTGTDPTLADTDGNGICDGEEDFDGDGLSNQEEIDYGTDPSYEDTDGDELTDYEEVKTYHTDPCKEDTDGDGLSDASEIEIGSDPLTAESEFPMEVTSEDDGEVQVSVSITLKADQVDSFDMEPYGDTFLFTDEMQGIIGNAYNFSVDGTFEKAKLEFTFDESLLQQEDFEPVIYYVDEEAGEMEELPTTLKGNTASTEVQHFSSYVLVNKTEYEKAFSWIEACELEQFTNAEVVLVIDDTGSMATNDPDNKRLSAAKGFINRLPEACKIGVVQFSKDSKKLTKKLVSDKAEAKKYLTTDYFKSSGGTEMYKAIENSFSLFEAENDDTVKIMLVLTDSTSKSLEKHDAAVRQAKEENVRLYTIGLGDRTSYFKKYLKPLAEDTNGVFYTAASASKLSGVFQKANQRIDLIVDSDGDGLTDYMETDGVYFNGVKIDTDETNPDMDGDGLTDGEEVGEVQCIQKNDGLKMTLLGTGKSHPKSKDTDGDGLYDNQYRMANGVIVAPIDPDNKKSNAPSGMWNTHVDQQGKQVSSRYDYTSLTKHQLTNKLKNNLTVWNKKNKKITNKFIDIALALREGETFTAELAKPAIRIAKFFSSISKNATIYGAVLLNFALDENGEAYHSMPDTWQRQMGYNDLYDELFATGGNIKKQNFPFQIGNSEFMLWMWKGNYWNLHSGAEIGLYKYARTVSGTKHYDAINFEVPMKLSLYKQNFWGNFKEGFNWAPKQNQWWITGFTGTNWSFLNVKATKMAAIGSIDFSSHAVMYKALKRAVDNFKSDKKRKIAYKTYLIFDDKQMTVWINWYEGMSAKKCIKRYVGPVVL